MSGHHIVLVSVFDLSKFSLGFFDIACYLLSQKLLQSEGILHSKTAMTVIIHRISNFGPFIHTLNRRHEKEVFLMSGMA